ncbi:MAG: FtsX-like permease family protein [Acidothermaceae bacterium]
MTTSLRERPAAGATPETGGNPARRAVVRWAWRLYRREWRRQALILALLVVAIAATIIGLGAASNASLSADPTFGTANTIVTLPGSDTKLSSDIAAVRAQFGTVEVIEHQSVPIPGSVANLDVRAEDPSGPYGHVMLRLDAGRYPNGAGEVAMTAGAAKTFGLHLGDQWTENGRTLRIVGTVENPLNLLDQFALVSPGQANSPTNVSILFNAGQHALDSFRLPGHTGISSSGRGTTNKAAAEALVLVLATLGLVFVGLMAVAGFAVMARRRQRALGMLASLGATDRHLRLVVLANGAIVGAVAAIVGTVIGLAGWFALAPALESVTKHRIDRLSLPWWAIGTAMLLTFVTAIAAAWWPARSVARLSPVAALSGRPARPQPAHRFATAGLLLLAGGIVLLAFADGHRVGFIVGGTVATAIGILLLAPLAIRLLAIAGRRSPIAVTLALRDLARYQARSGAALGAITLAVGIAATICINASTSETPTGPGNLGNNQLMMYVSRAQLGDPWPSLSAAQLQNATTAVDQVAATLHASTLQVEQAYDAGASAMPLAQAGTGPGAISGAQVAPVSGQPGQPAQASGYLTPSLADVVKTGRGERVSAAIPLYVATPAVLAHFGIAAAQIHPDADIITARTDLGSRQIFDPTPKPGNDGRPRATDAVQPAIQVIGQLPAYTSAPSVFLTPHAMQTLGLKALPAGWLLQTSTPLTAAQIDLATKAAAGAGLYVEERTPQKSLAPLRNWSTAAGILLALGVLGMTVGLIRSETAGDLRTLAAAGASSSVRRTLTAVTAGALALLGGVVGTAGAYAALLAWNRSNLTPLGRVPIANLVVIIVGLPVIAVVTGWLLAGREPVAIARQPLE